MPFAEPGLVGDQFPLLTVGTAPDFAESVQFLAGSSQDPYFVLKYHGGMVGSGKERDRLVIFAPFFSIRAGENAVRKSGKYRCRPQPTICP